MKTIQKYFQMNRRKTMTNQNQETTNYDMFSLIKGNRPIEKDRVKRLQKQIKQFGLKNPILVTTAEGILDLIRAINKDQKNWTAVNVGNSYAQHDDLSYRRYMSLIELGVSHSFILHACAEFSKGVRGVQCSNNHFRKGELLIPENIYEMIKGLILLFKGSGIDKKIWNRQYFIRALMKLKSVKEFDTYRFIDNFERFPYEWKDAYQTMDILRSILHVHNYRNRDKAKYFIE